jgi:hypothetical protein
MPKAISNTKMLNSKPTDAQLSMLRAALGREDRCLSPLPALRGAQIVKAGDRLVAAGWARELTAKASLPIWRRHAESGAALALKLTAAGARAAAAPVTASPGGAGRGDDGEPHVRRGAAAATPDAKVDMVAAGPTGNASDRGLPRATSKLAAVIGMLRRPEGATLVDLVAATGWLPHTTRAALTGVRKRGYVVALDRSDRVGGSVYRIEAKLSEGAAGSSEVSAAAT